MAILHGLWVRPRTGFFLWGETWKSLPKQRHWSENLETHPYTLDIAELKQWLNASAQVGSLSLTLPTTQAGVVYSASPPSQSEEVRLLPWEVTGLWLDPLTTMKLLVRLPMGDSDPAIAADLRFWSQCARWILDLSVRSKFLPGLVAGDPPMARWLPLLDSAVDRERQRSLLARFPGACRAADPTLPPVSVLDHFLETCLDAQVRATAQADPVTAVGTFPSGLTRQWLQALSSPNSGLPLTDVDELLENLNTWQSPLHYQDHFRTSFRLEPPPGDDKTWTLHFLLQDDSGKPLDAQAVWATSGDLQETFLAGLGLASRIYGGIETGLMTRQPTCCTLTTPEVFQFLKAATWRLRESGFGVLLPDSLSEVGSLKNRLGLRIEASTPERTGGLGMQSLLSFRWELALGGKKITRAEFEKLAASQDPLVQVGGTWVEMRPQDVRAARKFFESGQDQAGLTLEHVLRLSVGDSQTIAGLPIVNFDTSGPLKQLLENLNDQRNLTPIDEPEGFQGVLRPYQKLGVGWLKFLGEWGLGACLADDMGLGKTVQLLAFVLHLAQEGRLEAPILLICPTSVMGNWEREVKKFSPSLQVHVHHGNRRPKGRNFVEAVQTKQIVISNYALVQRDSKDLKRIQWQGLVLDEAQNIKNPEAKQTQAIRELTAQFRIALTGTPVENRLGELWSILDFLNPGYLGAKNFFQRRFAIPIEKYADRSSLKSLRALVQPFILRRLKSDPLIIQDLPEKQENTVFCPLTPEQAALYEKIVNESLEKIEESTGIQRRGVVLATLVKLKQICNHPSHFLGDKSELLDRSGKLSRLEEMLEEVLAEDDRALIFTQFAEWGGLLQRYLHERLKSEVFFLYGSTSKNQREGMIDRFQHDPQGPRLFILSLKAGGTGLNLTRANHVFHFDRWWNPAVENQATDRVFRIGQTKNVQVYKFVCTGTLEERIHLLIESKKALAEQVVSAGENWLSEMSTDQLRQLLLLDRSEIIDTEVS
jgi:SNF2 family DNA or RNA helicase